MNNKLPLLLLLIVFIASCHQPGKQSSPTAVIEHPPVKDTFWIDDSTYQFEMLKPKMDSAERIRFFTDFCIGRLNAHPGKAMFDTTVLLNGFLSGIHFFQGTIFSGAHSDALVYVHDNDENPVLFFTQQNGWKLKQVIRRYGVLDDTAIRFQDFNFDGLDDLVIAWNYSSGRCSCGSNSCWEVYLYNDSRDSLARVPALEHYLDFGLSEKEKAVYLGEHCDGFYGRFKWVGDKLVKTEAYLSNEEDYLEHTGTWTMEHVIYKDRQSIPVGKKANGELPLSWQHAFGWDREEK